MRFVSLSLIVIYIVTAFPAKASGQSTLPRFALGAKASTLGIGIEGATAVTERSNLRFGFNFFDYDRREEQSGIDYAASLDLRSVQLTYDQYLFSGFHVGPGLLLYNGNQIRATASVPPGNSFTLGGTRYFSGAANPIRGSAGTDLGSIAPMVLVGVGNLLPRSGRRFGFNFDAGVVFQGSPKTQLNLAGTACAVSPTAGCVDAGSDPTVQSNVQAEQEQLNEDLKPLKYYPVLSIGVSWRF